VREAQADEPHRGGEEQLEGGLEPVVGHVGRLARRRAAGVPHEDVNPVEGLERLRDEAVEVSDVRDVAAHRERADPVGIPLELLAPAREHRHVRSLGGERLRGGLTEPRRGAANDRRPPPQTEIHASGR
jgi:hypothetical protein